MSSAASATAGSPADVAAPRGRRKFVVAAVGVFVLAMAAGYWFLLRPDGSEEPKPGEVVTLEPIQVNLAAGRYLRLGLALQMSADVTEEVDGSKALDAAIRLYSGASLDTIDTAQERGAVQAELKSELGELYEGGVIDVYLTEFVTQ